MERSPYAHIRRMMGLCICVKKSWKFQFKCAKRWKSKWKLCVRFECGFFLCIEKSHTVRPLNRHGDSLCQRSRMVHQIRRMSMWAGCASSLLRKMNLNDYWCTIGIPISVNATTTKKRRRVVKQNKETIMFNRLALLTPPPDKVFSCCHLRVSKISNASSKIRSPEQYWPLAADLFEQHNVLSGLVFHLISTTFTFMHCISAAGRCYWWITFWWANTNAERAKRPNCTNRNHWKCNDYRT